MIDAEILTSGMAVNFPSISSDGSLKRDLKKRFFVQNVGDADLVLQPVTRVGSGEFAISAYSPNATILPPGASVSFTVSFSALAAFKTVSQTAVITIPSNDPNFSLFNVNLASIVPTGIWQTHGAYFSADLRDRNEDGIPDRVADMYLPRIVTATGDLDGDGVTNLAQYRLGFDLLRNTSSTDFDNDGLENVLEDAWGKVYSQSKYNFADAYEDPDGDGLLTIEELKLTWGTPSLKDPRAVATNPFLTSTGPNISAVAANTTAAAITAATNKLTFNTPTRTPPSIKTPANHWNLREAGANYAAWMNDGLLRKACRENVNTTSQTLPADFFNQTNLQAYQPIIGSDPTNVSGYDHIPLGYWKWLSSKYVPQPAAGGLSSGPSSASQKIINDHRLPSNNSETSDADLDLMPNQWEAAYGLNWRDSTDASLPNIKATIIDYAAKITLSVAEKDRLNGVTLAARMVDHTSELITLTLKDGTIRQTNLINSYPVVKKVPTALAARPASTATPTVKNDWEQKRVIWQDQFTLFHAWPYLDKIDPDHDGLVNADEYALGLDPTLADYAGTGNERDTDGDGFTDAQELLAGTDSKLAASKPVLTLKVLLGANQSGRPFATLTDPIIIQSVYQGPKGGFAPAPGTTFTITAPNNFTLLAALNATETPETLPKAQWSPGIIGLTQVTDDQGKLKIGVKLPYEKGLASLTLKGTKAALKATPITTKVSIIPDPADTDGDGMPDAWETQIALTTPLILPAHGLNKALPTDAEVDPTHYGYHRDTPHSALPVTPVNIVAELALLRQGDRLITPASLSSVQGLTAARKTFLVGILTKIDPDNDGLSNLEEYQQRATGLTHPKIGIKPHITVQPKNLFTYVSQSGKLEVGAITGDGRANKLYLYEWFEGSSGVTNKLIKTTKTPEFELQAPWQDGAKSPNYWVRVTAYDQANEGADKLNVQTTNSLTAYAQAVKRIEITEQPKGATIGIGKTVKLTVTATGGATGLPLMYQWYKWHVDDDGITAAYQPIPGATKSSYTTPAITKSSAYRVAVSYPENFALDSTVDSQAALIDVPAAPVITEQPERITMGLNSKNKFTVSAEGYGGELKYQWGAKFVWGTPFMSLDTTPGGKTKDGFSSIMERTSKDKLFETPMTYANSGYYVKVAVSDSLGNITLSEPVELFVTDSPTQPVIVAEPKNTYRPRANGDYEFLIGATGYNKDLPDSKLKYQWYRGKSPDLTQPILGATDNLLTIPKSSTPPPEVWVKVYNYRKYPDPVGSYEEAARSLTVPSGQIIASGGSGGGRRDGKGDEKLEPNEPFELIVWQPSWEAVRWGQKEYEDEIETGHIKSYFGDLKRTTIEYKTLQNPSGWALPSWSTQIEECTFPFATALSTDQLNVQHTRPADIPFSSDLLVATYPSPTDTSKLKVPRLEWVHSRTQIVAIRPNSNVKIPVNLAQGTEKTYLIVKTVRKDIGDKNPTVSVVGSHTFKIEAGKAYSDPMPDISQDNFQSFFSLGRTEHWEFDLLPIDLAIDADRNGTIASGETASQDKPFRFWINDDDDDFGNGNDIGGTFDHIPAVESDHENNRIDSFRDLEDLARLSFRVDSLWSQIKSGEIQLGLKWSDTSGGSPSINVFRQADQSGEPVPYFVDDDKAWEQAGGGSGNASKVMTVSGTAASYFPQSFIDRLSSSSAPVYLLFEGAEKGKGKLNLVLRMNGQESTGAGVWINLMDVRQLFMRGRTQWSANQIGDPWDEPNPYSVTSMPDNTPAFVADPDEAQQTIVFVHGWNMTENDWRNWSEMTFKRLWQLHYKGRFATFRWPTFSKDTHPNTSLLTYNRSEYRSWLSGGALASFVNGLPYPGSRYLMAHSMGNVISGSALLEGMNVTRYVMCNAAMAAMSYDGDITNAPLSLSSTPDTDTDPATQALGLRNKFNNNRTTYINYYLPDDDALQTWIANQQINKPELFLNSAYAYNPNEPPGSKLYYTDGSIFQTRRNITRLPEAMGHVTKSRSHAAGALGHTNGSISSKVGMDSFGFEDEHSAEWNWSLPASYRFWRQLFDSFDIKTPAQKK